ncbi:MAG TPA: hypothetical protein PK466_09255 [Thermotogota bacterium]|nr:hypothetical protein [Thermotogota bacterium]
MIKIFERILYFLPYIIVILVASLFFLLSFDVFSSGTPLEKGVGFLIQNLPTAGILIVLLFSKKYPKICGWIFIGIWGFFFFFFRAYAFAATFIIILPILIAGSLFLFQERFKDQ